jgi:GH15 family glucan-1,4-alpha-glucosidase
MYPSIAEYALIGDCHSAALVSRAGSIDWCCMPRFDSDCCFGRLLDSQRGGHFSITSRGARDLQRVYLPRSLVLVTTFSDGANVVRLTDFFAMRRGGRHHPRRELVRIVEGVRGRMSFDIEVSPRFDFGEVRPWIYSHGTRSFAAVGSNKGLLIASDLPLQLDGEHDLKGAVEVAAGARYRFAVQFSPPEALDGASSGAELDDHLAETLGWWQEWSSRIRAGEEQGPCIVRSAIVLKAMSYAPTGAIVAAPTTSLPESIGGERNWDYRFSWVRDSIFTVHTLAALGCMPEADAFRRFIQRSAAGNASELQVLYGVDGKRRLTEVELRDLEGWRGSRPVRVGNDAHRQFQSDMYGLILELTWRWSERGNSPDEHYWAFLVELVEEAIAWWPRADHGIWEIRSAPRHFVHSKVMCWAAVNRGIGLAERHSLSAPFERWKAAREEIRAAVETHGVRARDGSFVESFGSEEVDAALLLLPTVEFVAYEDPRMLATAERIRTELAHGGLILRYRTEDGLVSREGVFLPCSFWLAECLARQGRTKEAVHLFEHTLTCANDLGLFAEEYAPELREPLGNFPQALTHLAHIAAALAIERA